MAISLQVWPKIVDDDQKDVHSFTMLRCGGVFLVAFCVAPWNGGLAKVFPPGSGRYTIFTERIGRGSLHRILSARVGIPLADTLALKPNANAVSTPLSKTDNAMRAWSFEAWVKWFDTPFISGQGIPRQVALSDCL